MARWEDMTVEERQAMLDACRSAPGAPIIIIRQGEGHRRWREECERLSRANGTRKAGA